MCLRCAYLLPSLISRQIADVGGRCCSVCVKACASSHGTLVQICPGCARRVNALQGERAEENFNKSIRAHIHTLTLPVKKDKSKIKVKCVESNLDVYSNRAGASVRLNRNM